MYDVIMDLVDSSWNQPHIGLSNYSRISVKNIYYVKRRSLLKRYERAYKLSLARAPRNQELATMETQEILSLHRVRIHGTVLSTRPNEALFFYTTKEDFDNSDITSNSTFDIIRCGFNGSINARGPRGKGTYLTNKVQLADQKTHDNKNSKNKNLSMLVVRAALGRTVIGEPLNEDYDTAVLGNGHFFTKNNDHLFPQLLIEYSRTVELIDDVLGASVARMDGSTGVQSSRL